MTKRIVDINGDLIYEIAEIWAEEVQENDDIGRILKWLKKEKDFCQKEHDRRQPTGQDNVHTAFYYEEREARRWFRGRIETCDRLLDFIKKMEN